MVTADVGGTLIIWRFDAEKESLATLSVLPGVHSDAVCSLSLLESPSGLIVISAAGDGMLKVNFVSKTSFESTTKSKGFLPLYPLCVAATRIKARVRNREKFQILN